MHTYIYIYTHIYIYIYMETIIMSPKKGLVFSATIIQNNPKTRWVLSATGRADLDPQIGSRAGHGLSLNPKPCGSAGV